MGTRRIISMDHHSNRNIRDLLHHILVLLHQKKSEYNIQNFKAKHAYSQGSMAQGVVILLYMQYFLGTTQKHVMMTPRVSLSIDITFISCESVQRKSRSMEPSFHMFLHQTGLHIMENLFYH